MVSSKSVACRGACPAESQPVARGFSQRTFVLVFVLVRVRVLVIVRLREGSTGAWVLVPVAVGATERLLVARAEGLGVAVPVSVTELLAVPVLDAELEPVSEEVGELLGVPVFEAD